MTVLWTFAVLGASAQVRSKPPQATYSYHDSATVHTVKVAFVNKTTIRFDMALRNRKTGHVCVLRGEAHTEPGGSTGVDTDEAGNGYLALAFNYYQGPVFVSFEFQLQRPLWHSPRLQIGASGQRIGCDYNSTEYILARDN